MAASAVDSRISIYGDLQDERTTALAERLGAAVLPMSSAPKQWHIRVEQGKLVFCIDREERFALSTYEIERRLKGFTESSLARACQASAKPVVLDGLSGWGTDGLLLALAGCEVVCCEINPLVGLMNQGRALEMGLMIDLRIDDVANVIAANGDCFDVIYLDEMFPEHPKGALPSKSMQVLKELASTCNLTEIFNDAMNAAKHRVVVKRRRTQAPVSEFASWSIKTKSVRFDVYATNQR